MTTDRTLPDEDTEEGDRFWTSVHNFNRHGKAVNDALAAEEAAILEWAKRQAEHSARRDRWRRVLGEETEDGGGEYEAEAEARHAILRSLRSLSWEGAEKLLDIVAQNAFERGFAAGVASVKLGRPGEWTYDALLDLLADIKEAKGATLTAQRLRVADDRKMDYDVLRRHERRARRLLKSGR